MRGLQLVMVGLYPCNKLLSLLVRHRSALRRPRGLLIRLLLHELLGALLAALRSIGRPGDGLRLPLSALRLDARWLRRLALRVRARSLRGRWGTLWDWWVSTM